MEKINYYLVLEKRLGDYTLIDINKLDICNGYTTNDLAAIDNFTLQYSEKEIKDSIERSNMADSSYLDGSLKIISDVKHNLKIITKDMFNIIMDFQTKEENIDQNVKNKLFGSYKKIVENTFKDQDFIKELLDIFKWALRRDKKEEMFKIIEDLPYNKSRNIYLTIYDIKLQQEKENSLNLKKLNENV